ncbi:hypothetical protein LY76DRAFT_596309 [Colletotrichum caudatum]|nr:hypothetical protein LY76DRAFT_596309 [Colletotrichum caudatum]
MSSWGLQELGGFTRPVKLRPRHTSGSRSRQRRRHAMLEDVLLSSSTTQARKCQQSLLARLPKRRTAIASNCHGDGTEPKKTEGDRVDSFAGMGRTSPVGSNVFVRSGPTLPGEDKTHWEEISWPGRKQAVRGFSDTPKLPKALTPTHPAPHIGPQTGHRPNNQRR